MANPQEELCVSVTIILKPAPATDGPRLSQETWTATMLDNVQKRPGRVPSPKRHRRSPRGWLLFIAGGLCLMGSLLSFAAILRK